MGQTLNSCRGVIVHVGEDVGEVSSHTEEGRTGQGPPRGPGMAGESERDETHQQGKAGCVRHPRPDRALEPGVVGPGQCDRHDVSRPRAPSREQGQGDASPESDDGSQTNRSAGHRTADKRFVQPPAGTVALGVEPVVVPPDRQLAAKDGYPYCHYGEPGAARRGGQGHREDGHRGGGFGVARPEETGQPVRRAPSGFHGDRPGTVVRHSHQHTRANCGWVAGVPPPTLRPRNDPRQYDDLAGAWWDRRGAFAMLHWLAEARAGLVPPAPRPGALLVDMGCGGGLLGPHLAGKGYHHVGVDLTGSALECARAHGVEVVRANVAALPIADGSADVVCAGEILEHVSDTARVVAEACRVLRPGGLLVIDTIASTRIANLLAIEVAERLPGAAPAGIHDPALFVDRQSLVASCAHHGVSVELRGLRPRWIELAGWLARRRETVSLVPLWTTAILFQAWGVKTSESLGGGDAETMMAGTEA